MLEWERVIRLGIFVAFYKNKLAKLGDAIASHLKL